MSDLDKMMKKLKDDKKEKPAETDKKEDQETQEDDQDPQGESKTKKEVETPTEDPTPTVDDEIAILQNDGVFRHQILGALRELIDVQKINAQALIELHKLIKEGLNGKN